MVPGRISRYMAQAANRPLVALKFTREEEVSEESGPKETYPKLGMIPSNYVFPSTPL